MPLRQAWLEQVLDAWAGNPASGSSIGKMPLGFRGTELQPQATGYTAGGAPGGSPISLGTWGAPVWGLQDWALLLVTDGTPVPFSGSALLCSLPRPKLGPRWTLVLVPCTFPSERLRWSLVLNQAFKWVALADYPHPAFGCWNRCSNLKNGKNQPTKQTKRLWGPKYLMPVLIFC